jgi:hypothetical protein
LPFTTNASKEHYQQKIIYLVHGLFCVGYYTYVKKIVANILKSILKTKF